MSVQRLNSGIRLLAAAVSLAMFAAVCVVFVEPFRTDESWFIYRALLGIEMVGPVDATAAALRVWFGLFDGLWPGLLLLRGVTLFGYIMTICLGYVILRRSLIMPTPELALVSAVAFASWLALNRGFEIRPEIWAHLSMLLALAVGMGWSGLKGRAYLIALAVLLFFPTIFSFRFWPICFALFFVLVGLGGRTGVVPGLGFGRVVAATVAFLAILLTIHVFALDLRSGLASAASWQESNDRQLSNVAKLRYAIDPSIILAFYALCAAALLLSATAVALSFRTSQPLLALFVLAPIVAHYTFFFLFDVKPLRYTRALEAIALLASFAVAFKSRLLQYPFPSALPVAIACALAAGTTLVAYRELGTRYHFLEAFFRHSIHPAQMAGGLDKMHSSSSLIQQISTRVDYCREWSTQNVLIDEPMGHPFCGVDLGSVYNTGFRAYPEAVRFAGAHRSLGPILVSTALAGNLTKDGFICNSAGTHYAFCGRTARTTAVVSR